MNVLVKFLKDRGHVGADHAIGRAEAAKKLDVSVREVTKMGRESRLFATDGKFGEVVCFSKNGVGGGLFLAKNDDELLAVGYRLKREALTLLVELKKLKNGLSIQLYQGKLFRGIETIMEETPDEVPEESAEDDDGSDKPGEGDGGTPPGAPPGKA